MSGVRNSCETVATSSDSRRSAALKIGGLSLGDARRGDLAHDDDAADQRARGVAHRPGTDRRWKTRPRSASSKTSSVSAAGIGGDHRLHRGEVALGFLETGRDRRALRQRRIAREARRRSGREFLDDAVRQNRAPVETDAAGCRRCSASRSALVQLEHAPQRIATRRELRGLLGAADGSRCSSRVARRLCSAARVRRHRRSSRRGRSARGPRRRSGPTARDASSATRARRTSRPRSSSGSRA